MTTITAHTERTVNVLSIGVIPGTGVGSGAQASNVNKLNQWAAATDASGGAYTLYFPAGDYELNAAVNFSNKQNFAVYGPGAVIHQMGNDTRTFSFTDCDSVTVRDLKIAGRNISLGTPEDVQAVQTSLLYFFNCNRVRVSETELTGCASYTLYVAGATQLTITNNLLWNNESFPAVPITSTHGDIYVTQTAAGYLANSSFITITGNRCLSNNGFGINCITEHRFTTISDNQCISCDANLEEITSSTEIRRKESLVAQYSIDDANNDAQLTFTVSNNICRRARWSGIYINWNLVDSNLGGGIVGSVTGNEVGWVCMNVDTGDSLLNQGGITCSSHRQVSITGNTVHDVQPGQVGTHITHGIQVACANSEYLLGAASQIAKAVVSSNVVMRCERNYRVTGEAADVLFVGNISAEAIDNHFYLGSGGGTGTDTLGRVQCHSNRFIQEVSAMSYAFGIDFNFSSLWDTEFHNNHVEFTAGWTTASRYALRVTNGERCSIIGNTFIGPTIADDARAVRFETYPVNERVLQSPLAYNRFRDWTWGYFFSGPGVDPTAGPIVHTSSRFENVTNPVWSQQGEIIFDGQVHEPSVDGQFVHVWAPVVPAGGNWIVGDRITNSKPTVGSAPGWICTGAGQGPAATWTALPNL